MLLVSERVRDRESRSELFDADSVGVSECVATGERDNEPDGAEVGEGVGAERVAECATELVSSL